MVKSFKYFEEIKSYKPGKSKISDDDSDIIKLSSNENAFGASPKAINAYEKAAKEIFRYADGSCANLRESLAKKFNINADNIVCGAGSDEILALLAQGFAGTEDEIIYSKHGFLMYPISAKRVGAKAIAADEVNLKASVENILSLITPKTKIIFIANPNNPTGSYLNAEELDQLIAKTPKEVLIVIDNAYEELVDAKDYPDAINLVKNNENVVMTKTFSKVYGLASLRIGWCFASNYICDILNKIRGPFNVSGAAQVAAKAALEDEEFLQKSVEHNNKWREIFSEKLSMLQNVTIYESQGNFILIDFLTQEECQKVNQALLNNKIIVREMSAYQLPTCLRITIGKEEENKRVIETISNYYE